MKPFSYYQETSVSIPKKDDYMTIYYYKKGVMVGMKRQFGDDFVPPKGCVEEKVLDEVSFNAHMKHYDEERIRLQEEFRRDLIEEYSMTNHPKANKIFDKSWDMGISSGLQEVEYYFQDLIGLFKDVDGEITMKYYTIEGFVKSFADNEDSLWEMIDDYERWRSDDEIEYCLLRENAITFCSNLKVPPHYHTDYMVKIVMEIYRYFAMKYKELKND